MQVDIKNKAGWHLAELGVPSSWRWEFTSFVAR